MLECVVQMVAELPRRLVHQAVAERGEVGIAGVLLHDRPLAHGQCFCGSGGYHIAPAGVDKYLPIRRVELGGEMCIQLR